MIVTRGYSNKPERNIKNPLLEENGIWFELRGGHVVDPYFGNWFEPPWPKKVIRFFCKWNILPWFSYRLGNKGSYIGFKAYGADRHEYLNWMPKEDVFPGSEALCFSIRLLASVDKEND